MSNYYRLYEVGGCVRDTFLGVKSKDIDFTFEFTQTYHDEMSKKSSISMNDYFRDMSNLLRLAGFKIFLETPDCFTVRAKFPDRHEHSGTTADFVLARKETYPDPNTRTPTVEIGTLYDDLRRRDFTVNAIAVDEDGTLIDPFGGVQDIKDRLLRCPVDAKTSFNDDPLRMIRALRFSVTKQLEIDDELWEVMCTDTELWDKFKLVVSEERTREELTKMFKHDTKETLKTLMSLDLLTSGIDVWNMLLGDTLWLKPTNEKR